MKKLTLLLLITVSFFVFNSCEDDNEININFATFESTTYDFSVNLDGSSTNDIIVYSTKVTSSPRTYNISVVADLTTADPASYDVPATVTIPANSNEGILSVTVADINIDDGKVLVLKLENEPGLYTGENITLKLTQLCPLNEAILVINFDGYGSECTWEMLDNADNIIASGGPYSDGDVQTVQKFCLADGSYTFTIYDVYGDGLSYPNLGNASITSNGNEVVYIEGDFGFDETVTFNLGN